MKKIIERRCGAKRPGMPPSLRLLAAMILILSLGEVRAHAVASLHSKVYHLDIKGIEKLLSGGAEVNKKDGDGRTPLFYCLFPSAVNKTEVQDRVMDLLIKHGADVNAADRNGVTPLVEALIYGNVRAAEKLLEYGASPLSRDNAGSSALHKAAGTAGPDFVKKLIQGGCDVNWRDHSGWTPLHESAENGNGTVVSLLIKMGADVNALNEEQNTPLHLAVLEENVESIKELIGAGSDVNAKNQDGNTPLFLSMREYGEPAVKVLLENGAVVDLFNKEGITPLHRAAYFGLDAMAEMLIKAGARVDAETPQGVTPLHLAAQWAHKDTVKILLSRGADPSKKTGSQRNSETALHIAARNGFMDIARMLIDAGAPTDTVDGDGETPFQAAMSSSNPELAHFIGSYDKRAEPYYFVISSTAVKGDSFASSSLYDRKKKLTHAPSMAFDRSLKTSWISGGNDGPDRIAFYTRTAFSKLRIYPGWGTGRRDYLKNNRLKKALFTLYSAERHNFKTTGKNITVHKILYARELLFSDEMGYHEFELPKVKCVKGCIGVLEVKEVYGGVRGLTCIAEINPLP